MQPPPIEELLAALAVHRVQQRERLRVCPEQDVLTIVDGAIVDDDTARATAEDLRGFEHGHRLLGRRERDRSCHAGPAAAHDRDAAPHPVSLNTTTTSSTRSTPWPTASTRSCGRARGIRPARSGAAAPGRSPP